MLNSLNFNLETIPQGKLEDASEFSESDEKVTRVYLIRHGESQLNGTRYAQGKSPWVPLTKKGESQAAKLAEQMHTKLCSLKKPIFFTSTAVRTQETAKPLLQMWTPELLAERHEEFLERSAGDLESTNETDIKIKASHYPWDDLSANQKFSTPKFPSGESHTEVAARALRKLSEIVTKLQDQETAVIFTHCITIDAIALSLSNIRLSEEANSQLPSLKMENCDTLVIQIPKSSSAEEGRIERILRFSF